MVVRLENGRYTNWSETTVSNTNMKSIAYGNGKYVIASAGSKILTSSDGETWTTQTVKATVSGSDVPVQWNYVIYANNKFMVIGLYAATGNDYTGYIATSTDGSNWTVSEVGAGGLVAIAYNNNKYVIVGEIYDNNNSKFVGLIYTSTNGTTWTSQVLNEASRLECICYGNMFVAGGKEGKLYISSDGTTWQQKSSVIKNQTIFDIVYNNGTYVCVGTTATSTSTDGINWNEHAGVFLPALTNNSGTHLTCYNGVYIAMKVDYTTPYKVVLYTSSDGETWNYKGALGELPNRTDFGDIIHDTTKLMICTMSKIFIELPSQIPYMLTTKSSGTVKKYILTTKQSGTTRRYI